MRRVMFVGHTAKTSGGEIALVRLIDALRGRIEPVVVLGEDGPLVGTLQGMGVDVRVVPLGDDTRNLRKERLANPLVALGRVRDIVRYSRGLAALMRELRVDIVHTNTLKAGFYGCLAARLAGIPSVWHVRDRLAPDYLPRVAVLATRLGTAVLPTRVLTNSRATFATLSPRSFAVLGRKAALTPPIADPLDAGTVPQAPPRAEGAPFRIGMVGRLSPWKGQVVAVRAFAAAGLPPSARLVLMGSAMFGEQEYEREIHAEVDRLGLRDRVEFAGFVDDVLGALGTFDVLVHASTIPEPFGQVVLEGLAAGVPVVATREGGPGEIVTDGADGLLYDAGDADALAERLRELHSDAALRARLARGGRARAADFAPEVVGGQVLALYDGMVGARRSGQTA
ncbi:glycosyltransferase family 1 protein [Blastococcus sp. CT_GayMR20]|uniref:glycosyltransferase family 4 protein n=1 Tax=Blastococcus sp. CT_GayMR20 TaxID=2559609 RepID=UPI00107328B2|nr:glycosyltransferase family 4 protein [Blastococcus sp. CT_GayMR20]TFV88389.1 glycosyltransferase family 1 protein [Blastococcus sp. CT_GayMR20]